MCLCRWTKLTMLLAVAAFALGPLGCRAGASTRGQLTSDNPLDRATAAARSAETGDAAAVHALVDLLDDRDDVVRMVAIHSLRRLCGEDFGYRYYADDTARAAAVARWRDAIREGTVRIVASAPASPASPPERAPATPSEMGASVR